MASLDVKPEDGDYVKPDPEQTESTIVDDFDGFEDTGELELPPQLSHTLLLRVPRFLHEKWSDLDMDADITLGKIRRHKKNGHQQIVLNPQLKHHDNVPKAFDIEQTEAGVQNTYVFSEKDLPGFRKGARNKPAANHGGGGGGQGHGRVDKNHRYQHFRRAVPKQTALLGAITTELNCTPSETTETQTFLKERTEAAEHKRPRVELMTLDPRQTEGMSLNASREKTNFDGFVVPVGNKAKPQENKAARMPRNELLDLLFDNFDKWKYWSLKSLKQNLNQPEAYLKENLDAIADLIRTGPQTGQYKLKPEATRQAMTSVVKMDEDAEESNGPTSDDDGDQKD